MLTRLVLFVLGFFFCSAVQAQAEDGWVKISVLGTLEICNHGKPALGCAMLAAGQDYNKSGLVYIYDHGTRRLITGADVPKLGSAKETQFVYLPEESLINPHASDVANYCRLLASEHTARDAVQGKSIPQSESVVVVESSQGSDGKDQPEIPIKAQVGDHVTVQLDHDENIVDQQKLVDAIRVTHEDRMVTFHFEKAGEWRVAILSRSGAKRGYVLQVSYPRRN